MSCVDVSLPQMDLTTNNVHVSLEMKLDHLISQSVKNPRIFPGRAWGPSGAACGRGIDAETLLECFLAMLVDILHKNQSGATDTECLRADSTQRHHISRHIGSCIGSGA